MSKAQLPRGLALYLTGLSGSGKTTVCVAAKPFVEARIPKHQIAHIVDGDEIREFLSKGLSLTQQGRSRNVRRIGYLTSEIVKHGGFPLVANIAPFETDRQHNRELISQHGKYLEVYMDVDFDTCKVRDPKGLYKTQTNMTGHTGGQKTQGSNYEIPQNPDFRLDNRGESPEASAKRVMTFAEPYFQKLKFRSHPVKGAAVFLTGPNAGQTAEEVYKILAIPGKLNEQDVSLLDKSTQAALSFADDEKAFPSGSVDHTTGVARLGFVASTIARHGGIALAGIPEYTNAESNFVHKIFSEHAANEAKSAVLLELSEKDVKDPKAVAEKILKAIQ